MRALAVAAIVLAAAPAGASPRDRRPEAREHLSAALTDLQGHMHALRLVEARAVAEEALRLGAASRDQLRELTRSLGVITASLGDTAAAEAWFLVWLTIDPMAALPHGTSPKLATPFEAARARAKPLSMTLALETVAPGSCLLRARVTGNQGGLAQRAAFDIYDATATGELREQSRWQAPADREGTFSVAVGHRCCGSVDVSLLDAHGNELLAETHGSEVTRECQLWGDPEQRRPVLKRPKTYLLAGSLVGIAGGVFLWRRTVAEDDLERILVDSGNHTFADAERARKRAERYGWASLAGFATAGAFVTTAIVLGFRHHRADTSPVLLQPRGDGATVILTTPF